MAWHTIRKPSTGSTPPYHNQPLGIDFEFDIFGSGGGRGWKQTNKKSLCASNILSRPWNKWRRRKLDTRCSAFRVHRTTKKHRCGFLFFVPLFFFLTGSQQPQHCQQARQRVIDKKACLVRGSRPHGSSRRTVATAMVPALQAILTPKATFRSSIAKVRAGRVCTAEFERAFVAVGSIPQALERARVTGERREPSRFHAGNHRTAGAIRSTSAMVPTSWRFNRSTRASFRAIQHKPARHVVVFPAGWELAAVRMRMC